MPPLQRIRRASGTLVLVIGALVVLGFVINPPGGIFHVDSPASFSSLHPIMVELSPPSRVPVVGPSKLQQGGGGTTPLTREGTLAEQEEGGPTTIVTLDNHINKISIPDMLVKRRTRRRRKATIPEDPEFAGWNVNPWRLREKDDTRRRRSGGGSSTTTTTITTPFVVIGIPTIDTESANQRRQLQRRTWHRYPNVYHPVRNPNGSILIKYLIGRHWSHSFTFSESLRAEAQQYKDIVAFDMKEGRPATEKKAGGKGHWGLEVEVGMSRKALAWYVLADSLYSGATYISKGDDDYFLRTVEYESVLRSLDLALSGGNTTTTTSSPTSSSDSPPPLYWGLAMKWGAKKGDPKSIFRYIGGMSITMHRSHVRWIASADDGEDHPRDVDVDGARIEEEDGVEVEGVEVEGVEVKNLLKNNSPTRTSHATVTQAYMRPFQGEALKAWYKKANMDHEDVMVGRLFYDYNHPHTVVNDCRFHDVRNGANVHKITDQSIGLHHVWEEKEFFELMRRFPDGLSSIQLPKIMETVDPGTGGGTATEDHDDTNPPSTFFRVPSKKLPVEFSIGGPNGKLSRFATLNKNKC